MIDDPELRRLFKTESEEHLHRLEEGLLRLERDLSDRATLEEAFREAHSLKGAARMLGVSSVERIAHRFEDMLGAAKRGQGVLSPESIDHLYQQVDTIRQLVQEAMAEEGQHVDSPAMSETPTLPPTAAPVKDSFLGDETDVASVPEAPDAFTADEDHAPSAAHTPIMVDAGPQREEPQSPAPETCTGPYRIETIRIDPHRLDALMRLVGELTVTKIGIARRLAEIEDLVVLWDEWYRDISMRYHGLTASLDDQAAKQNMALVRHGHQRLEQFSVLVHRLRDATYEDNARLDAVANELQEDIRTIRLLPLATIFNLFPRMVRDLARAQAKEVQLVIEGADATADKHILEELKDPLMHLIRNAIDHGLEGWEERQRHGKPRTGSVQLRAFQAAGHLVVEVADDGRGLDEDAIRRTALKRRLCREEELTTMTSSQLQALIFAPGFSTSPLVTDVSGRGVGLDVVRSKVERLKGSIQVESSPGQGCLLRLRLPTSLSTTRVLIVVVEQRPYALPVDAVQRVCLVAPDEVFTMDGQDTMILDGEPVSLAQLSTLLRVKTRRGTPSLWGSKPGGGQQPRPCIILSNGQERVGFFVDALVDEQEVIVKPHGSLLKRVRNVAGATILGTGEVCIVLNSPDLFEAVRQRSASVIPEASPRETERKRVILLVEDSITTRTQEKRILESGGYDVVTAVDGIDALQKLSARAFDAVVSDVQMPNMDGLSLTDKIRQNKLYNELPIILVTSLTTEEDKRRGVEAGANAYITKPTFDQRQLLDTLKRLI